MIDQLELESILIRKAQRIATNEHRGNNCYIAKSKRLSAILQEVYGRPGLCLKIFGLCSDDPNGFRWSGTPLQEATQIQNLLAYKGLAPRVYALALLNGERLAQVTDYAQPRGKPNKRRAAQLARAYGIGVKDLATSTDVAQYIDRSPKWVGRWLIDFGRFYFRHPQEYEKKLREHVIRYHKKPHSEAIGYHPCAELGIEGKRNIDYRVKQMGLEDLDFRGKDVLDIGCNVGAFCHEAARRGARRVVGVDHKFVSGNRQLANWLGYWNVDFIETELPGGWKRITGKSGIREFDIVFCLSVAGHAGGYASWIPRLVGGMMYFSGQSVEPRRKYQAALDHDFERVEWLGYVEDGPHRRHPLWRCWKREADYVGRQDDRQGEALPESGIAAG